MGKKYGNAVAIDGAEISTDLRIDGGELTVPAMVGGEIGAFYNSGGATSYPQLSDKPSINGHTIIGDKAGEDYDLQDKITLADKHDIDKIFFGV